MRRILIILAVLMTMLAAAGAAEVKTYTYGGSGRDWLTDIDVSDNGCVALTGWTESSDGTLADRTKTGRSGWVLMIDRTGEVLWSFCSRLGNQDSMRFPVFHEDGTLTVILEAEDDSIQQLELIRLGKSGNVASRRVLMETNGEEYSEVVGRDERGYILYKQEAGYILYGYDGEIKGELDQWAGLYAIADRHVIRLDEPGGKEMWLYARDEQGNEVRQSKVFELREDSLRPELYDTLLSLPDGGAAGAGWVLVKDEETEARPGLFSRWDAQGRLVSQMRTEGMCYSGMALIPGGFAVTAYLDEDGPNEDLLTPWTLYTLDMNGVIQSSVPLGEAVEIVGPRCPTAALGDGTIVTVQVVPENGQDGKVTIVTP